jgi:hypothetical protein
LTAIGVANQNGRLSWPLGLQTLGGPDNGREADELRGQLDGLFQLAAEQAGRGSADTKLLDEITRAVDRFRKLLTRVQQERAQLTQALYDEAERFLNQLQDAEAALRKGLKTEEAPSR